jgi:hypothetical protein
MTELFNGLNWYDLYRKNYNIPDPSTKTLREESRLKSVEIGGETKTYKSGFTWDEYTPWLKRFVKDSPILGDGMTDYANRADVRKAMNIPDDIQAWL